MYPRLFGLGLFFLSLFGTAHAELKIGLEHVTEHAVRETLLHSFNFSAGGLIQPNGAGDQETETVRLTRLMQALGYLDAQTEEATGSDGPPLLLPVPGRLYSLGYVAVDGISGALPEILQTNLRLRTERHLGEPARADTIADMRRDVLRVFQESRFATPTVVAVEIRKYPSTVLAGLHISVEPGPQASFGKVILTGDGSLSELGPAAHLNGSPYDPAAVDGLRTDIQESGLFRRISVSVQPREGDPALVDIVAELKRNNRAEEDLAAHGLFGFSILLACGSLLILRQVAVAAPAGRKHRLFQVADIVLALALTAGAFFALQRVVFLIG